MNEREQISDIELASFISSKICHDVIGPVGAIYNGLELLAMDQDAESQASALDVIRTVTEQATARLQFARYAFGAAGTLIDLAEAERISRALVGQGRHKISWRGLGGHMEKDKVKLLLNLIAGAMTALPRGGEMNVAIGGTLEEPVFVIRCRGTGARPPQHLSDFVMARKPPMLDQMTAQAYYTCRLAAVTGMQLGIAKDGADVLLSAKAG